MRKAADRRGEAELKRGVTGPATRFIVAGGANTLVTGLLLAVLAQLINPLFAYTLVFAAGLVLSTYLAGSYVFRVKMDRRKVISYVFLYVVVYLVGLAVVALAVGAGADEHYTGLVVLITAPLSFLGARVLLTPAPATENRSS